jgi:hypothetical protein
MTWYREITPIQEPFDLGLDDSGRHQQVFNVDIVKAYSKTLRTEIVARLVAQGVGAFGTDIFATKNAIIPTGDGPYLLLIETGGTSPENTHNETVTPAYQRPSIQFTAIAKNPIDAETMVWVVYEALFLVNTNIP